MGRLRNNARLLKESVSECGFLAPVDERSAVGCGEEREKGGGLEMVVRTFLQIRSSSGQSPRDSHQRRGRGQIGAGRIPHAAKGFARRREIHYLKGEL